MKLEEESFEINIFDLFAEEKHKAIKCSGKLVEEDLDQIEVQPFLNHKKGLLLTYHKTDKKLFALNPEEEYSFMRLMHTFQQDNLNKYACSVAKNWAGHYSLFIRTEDFNLDPLAIKLEVKAQSLLSRFELKDRDLECPKVSLNDTEGKRINFEIKDLRNIHQNDLIYYFVIDPAVPTHVFYSKYFRLRNYLKNGNFTLTCLHNSMIEMKNTIHYTIYVEPFNRPMNIVRLIIKSDKLMWVNYVSRSHLYFAQDINIGKPYHQKHTLVWSVVGMP